MKRYAIFMLCAAAFLGNSAWAAPEAVPAPATETTPSADYTKECTKSADEAMEEVRRSAKAKGKSLPADQDAKAHQEFYDICLKANQDMHKILFQTP